MPRAVLWDLDGTLVDSEEFHWQAWRETMSGEGVSLTHEQFLETFGWRNDSIIPRWLPHAGQDLAHRIGEEKEARYRALVRERGLSPLPGAAEWVRRLASEGWLQAIASSAPRLNVDVVSEALGLAHYFAALVSAEDVARGKPDPEVFLTAASRLGVPAARCVVVEDAAAGTEAARRAGMRSIGIARAGKSLEADSVAGSLAGLPPDAFDRLVGRG